ncbi:MAG TPA: nucleoid occlusion protein [Epulopiscium sp.]|nr:nucleoid occlusion protein [Candidatus Epulonipiscium sp.]
MQKNLEIQYIKVEKIRPNPYQPRKFFEQSALEELGNSIKEHGLIQPITVRVIGDTYQLIAGERRLKASKLIGLEQIPAVITEVSNQDSAVLALIENLQRENLNFIEESQAYYDIMQDHGYTQQQLAKSIGKNQSTVANKLRLLKLPSEVIKKILEHNLSERHARALLRLPDKKSQLKALKFIIEKDLNVKRTEEMIDKILISFTQEGKIKKEHDKKVKRFLNDIRLFTNTITQAVDIIQQSGIDAKYTMQEKPEGYEIKIKIPMK